MSNQSKGARLAPFGFGLALFALLPNEIGYQDISSLLARQPGKVWNRDDILNQLRGQEAELYTRAVDIVISRLRKKLEPLDCIKTLRNAGYALAVAP